MDTIDGYEIYRIILFETGYSIVLGRMSRNSERFAVWSLTETTYRRDYYWKSSYEDRDIVEHIFQKGRSTIVCFAECGKGGTQNGCLLSL